jgi:hypothetical protein
MALTVSGLTPTRPAEHSSTVVPAGAAWSMTLEGILAVLSVQVIRAPMSFHVEPSGDRPSLVPDPR